MEAESAATAAVPDSGVMVSDVELLGGVLRGSETAFGSLYDRHAGAVFASALHATGDRQVAEEVVQDTFVTLWNRAELFDPEAGSLRTWLLTIARNRGVDRLRAAARRVRAMPLSSLLADRDDDGSLAERVGFGGTLVAAGQLEDPEATAATRETRAEIAAALARLEPIEREAVVLAYGAGLSQSEIADRLGWPLGTVKTRTRRAFRHLRELLADPAATASG